MGRGAHGDEVLEFGKFQGQALATVPNSYLGWLLKQDWFEDREEFEAVQDEMYWRKDNGVHVNE